MLFVTFEEAVKRVAEEAGVEETGVEEAEAEEVEVKAGRTEKG